MIVIIRQLFKAHLWLYVGVLFVEPLARAEELNLSQCLKMAQGRSLQSIQGILNESSAKAEYDESSSQRFPQLFGQARLARSNLAPDQLSDANRAVVRIEQKLNPFSPVWKQAEQKRLQWEASTQIRIESWQDAALLVKRLYYSVLRFNDAITRLDEVEELLKRLLSSVIPKFTVRRAAPFDVVKVKAAISDLSRARQLTLAELKGHQSQLSQMLGLKANDTLKLQTVSDVPELPSLEKLESDISLNPSLVALERNALAADVATSSARLARLPELVAGLDYGFGGAIGAPLQTGWEASLAARLPLFDWGLISAQIDQRAARASWSRNQFELEKQKTLSSLLETHAHATAQLADRERLQELLPDLQQTALASIDRYKTGGSGILETTDAIHLWVQTLLNERLAYYTYLMDIAQLKRLIGAEP